MNIIRRINEAMTWREKIAGAIFVYMAVASFWLSLVGHFRVASIMLLCLSIVTIILVRSLMRPYDQGL